MKKMIAVLAASTMTMTAAPVFAQDAMADAVRRNVCGSAAPVSAEYLADGSLRVLCPYGATGAGAAAAGARWA